jgi:preprotein translocase subunit SecD
VAAPTQAGAKPGRTLAILGLLTLALTVWTFWPGLANTPKLGLDLRGGTQVILTPTSATGGGAVTDEQLKQTVEIIRQRVDGFGVAEAEVTTQGSGSNATIVVSIPGASNEQVIETLSTTAKLDFRPVLAVAAGIAIPTPTESPSASPSASASGTASASPSASATASPESSATPTASSNGAVVPNADSASPSASASASPSATGSGTLVTKDGITTAPGGLPPITSATNDEKFQQYFVDLDCSEEGATKGGPADPAQYLITCSTDGAAKYLLDPAAVEGTEIASAQAGLSQGGVGGWEVQLTFTSEGAKQFAEVTAKLATQQPPQNQFAITLDGLVQSAPQVNEAILGGSAVITGSFTAEEAKALANVLKYGSLPVALEVSQVEQLSPTLGADQLRAGIIAGLLGLALVVIYLVIYYRALGLVATASLLIAALWTYCLLVILGRSIGYTLSLAGVAGAIVAIGITADSFVVYFERLRDELRDGRTYRQAGDIGWTRARRTILAADFVSMLAAVVLYVLSVGSVRGFAFTLGLTTIVDVIIAFFFTRPLVQMLLRTKAMTSGAKWTGLSADHIGGKMVEREEALDDAPRRTTLAASRSAEKES